MNKNLVFLIGRLVADPDLRFLPDGTPVANFSLAVNRSIKNGQGKWEDKRDGFFDCEFFGRTAEAFAQEFTKGAEVQISGSLRQKQWKSESDPNRTLSRIEIRVESLAPVLRAAKPSQETTVEEQPVPQPA